MFFLTACQSAIFTLSTVSIPHKLPLSREGIRPIKIENWTGDFAMAQIHKQFSTEQVKNLFKRYMDPDQDKLALSLQMLRRLSERLRIIHGAVVLSAH